MTQRVFALTEDPGGGRKLVQLTLTGTVLAEVNVVADDSGLEPVCAASKDAKYVAVLNGLDVVVYTRTTGNTYVGNAIDALGDVNAGDAFPAIAITPLGEWIATARIYFNA